MKRKGFNIKISKILKVIINFFFLIELFTVKNLKSYSKDDISLIYKLKSDITLVTALFKIKSKHPFKKYLNWVENLLLLNCSIIFFVDKDISHSIKNRRPRIYDNKTIWIETSISNFYSYKKFMLNFIESYKIDIENSYHTVNLYLVWAEKCNFLKKAIHQNYFHSKCFYWIDAGYFRKKEEKYINDWPKTKKCNEDPRVLINGIRQLSNIEIEGLKKFNMSLYEQFIKKDNVSSGLFGGKPEYLLKFIYLYYKAIIDFINHNMFIGKEQNLFAFVSYLNPKIVKIINSGQWYFFKSYLS